MPLGGRGCTDQWTILSWRLGAVTGDGRCLGYFSDDAGLGQSGGVFKRCVGLGRHHQLSVVPVALAHFFVCPHRPRRSAQCDVAQHGSGGVCSVGVADVCDG